MMSINKLDSTKQIVFDHIRNNYKISTDIQFKIKASTLLDSINKLSVKISYNKLAKYLTELGLQRKRLFDGMYYYGLEPFTLVSSKKKELKYGDEVETEREFTNHMEHLEKMRSLENERNIHIISDGKNNELENYQELRYSLFSKNLEQ